MLSNELIVIIFEIFYAASEMIITGHISNLNMFRLIVLGIVLWIVRINNHNIVVSSKIGRRKRPRREDKPKLRSKKRGK